MKLNLGCGNKRKQGFVGVDFAPCDAADILADLTGALPFTDSSIDEIWLDNVIEHIQDIPQLMRELHRICRDGAIITLITPHFASADSWRDPTHVHHLSFFSMDHFQRQGVAHYTGGGFSLVSRKLSFCGVMGNIGRLIFAFSPSAYEKNWCFIFRPGTLTFTRKVI
jgi:ubiquinone/menaquinone biosynthesis C-methylase UbiE